VDNPASFTGAFLASLLDRQLSKAGVS
jgi:hypothetical protein